MSAQTTSERECELTQACASQPRERTPLFPRMKASPYLAFSCPLAYSSVCSIAMFM